VRKGSHHCPRLHPTASGALRESVLDLVMNAPERREPGLLGTGGTRGIFKGPVESLHRTGDDGAPLVVADRDEIVPWVRHEADVQL
jgi:hypothetical protein